MTSAPQPDVKCVPISKPTREKRSAYGRLATEGAFLLIFASLLVPSLSIVRAEQPDRQELLTDDQLSMPTELGLRLPAEVRVTKAPMPLHLEPIAKPIDTIAQTPWKTPVYETTTLPGIVVSQKRKFPWGMETEWRVGVAVKTNPNSPTDFTDSSLWSVKTAIGDRFYIYLHDKGSGFVKFFGDSLSVYGRILNGSDKTMHNSTLQVGAARSF